MRWAELRRGAVALERWLLPAACLLCRGRMAPRDGERVICPSCRARWHAVAPPWCPRCGETLDGEGCATCLEWPPDAPRVRSAVVLSGGAQRAVHLLKYEGWHGVADAMAEAMVREHRAAPGTVLVPVPLGRRRRRQRGYNQAEVLARALAARSPGTRVAPGLLARTRDTGTQTKLTPEARRANVHRAFEAASPLPSGPLLLVDDVFTTGATLLAAAEALVQGGAPPPAALTFARAPGPLGPAGS